jgi:hypothetical protein
MRIQSWSYNKNKRSFSINPLAPHSSRIRKILLKFEFGLFYFITITSFLFLFLLFFPLFFYSLPSFLKSHM